MGTAFLRGGDENVLTVSGGDGRTTVTIVQAAALYAPEQACQTHSHRGPHQPRGCLQRANVILGLYKCNYSLTVKQELGAAAG